MTEQAEQKDSSFRIVFLKRAKAVAVSFVVGVKKARTIAISSIVGVAVGVLAGFFFAHASFAWDGMASFAFGMVAYACGHGIERAYRYWRVPSDMERWGLEYEQMGFETIRAGIRFAQCQVALAEMVERCPRPFEDVLMRTSELGHAMHHEALRHAREAGFIAPSKTPPEASSDSASSVIDVEAVSVPPPSSSEALNPEIPRLLPMRSSSTTNAGRSKYTMRDGKLVRR